jgi:hypothetical protein
MVAGGCKRLAREAVMMGGSYMKWPNAKQCNAGAASYPRLISNMRAESREAIVIFFAPK